MNKNGNVFLIQFDFGSSRETPVNKGLPLQRDVPNEPNEQIEKGDNYGNRRKET